jgi:hypothetical protein
MAFWRRLHQAIWILRAMLILCAAPFRWSPKTAAQYARGLYHLNLEEGFSPAEAIDCDRQYWEA